LLLNSKEKLADDEIIDEINTLIGAVRDSQRLMNEIAETFYSTGS
jgi:hypothetical protein